MRTSSAVLAGLAGLAGTLVITLVPAVPAVSAAPVLTIAPDLPVTYPRQVPLSASGQTTRISVVLTSSEPVTVTARSDDGALTIAEPERSFEALDDPTTVSFDVAALSQGFHALEIHMDGTGPTFSSVALRFGHVWASGSPLPDVVPGSRRPFQVYGYQAAGSAPQLLTFASREYAHLGLPANGQPTCAQEGDGCVRYWRESGGSGVVQIGTGIVGAFHRGGFYTDGFVPAGPTTGTPYGRHDFINALAFVGRRSAVQGTYAYVDRSRTSGLTRQKVRFLRYAGNLVGEYRLTYAYAGGTRRTLEGTFSIEKGGAITFRDDRGRVVQRGTLLRTLRALPCATAGTCRSGEGSGKRGIWLVLSGRRGTHPDGNLLMPV